jgi:hypothetical protein
MARGVLSRTILICGHPYLKVAQITPAKAVESRAPERKILLGSWDLTNGPTLFEHRAVVHTMAQMFPSAS